MNISWKHGINALSAEEQQRDPRGRISIVLWGLCPPTMVQEEGETDAYRASCHTMPCYS